MATEYQLTEDQFAKFSEDLSQEDKTTIILQDGQARVLDAMTVEGGAIDDATAPALSLKPLQKKAVSIQMPKNLSVMLSLTQL